MPSSRLARFLALLAACAVTGCPRPAPREREIAPTPTPIPVPTPTPPPYVPAKRLDTGKIFNGMQYRVTLETEFGATATTERADPASYRAELVLKVRVPKPHKNLAEISQLNPRLAEILPALPAMLETAKISPVFDDLYRLKCDALKLAMNRLDTLLTRHNFYDCETLLELQHPQSKRRALFIQADMDVDTDGSDVDRFAEIEGASSTFQPFTSYSWQKRTANISPLIAPRETRLRELDEEAKSPVLAARREQIKTSVATLKAEVENLKTRRFLVGHADPFIVLPGSMFGENRTGPFAPNVGDYCVVIHDGVLYPAIVGDVGPRAKMGEAALRICKQIQPASSGASRPVNDLKVTYLVFPGTRERPFTAPDLEKWRTKCAALLEEFGGHKGELFVWEDIAKPPAPAAAPPANLPAATPPSAP